MLKRDISVSLYQKCFILCSKIVLNVFHNMSLTDHYHDNRLGSRPPHTCIKSFSGHLWHSILIFANSTSYPWFSKSINMLVRLCSLVWHFQAENHQHIKIEWVGTEKEWVAMGTEFHWYFWINWQWNTTDNYYSDVNHTNDLSRIEIVSTHSVNSFWWLHTMWSHYKRIDSTDQRDAEAWYNLRALNVD